MYRVEIIGHDPEQMKEDTSHLASLSEEQYHELLFQLNEVMVAFAAKHFPYLPIYDTRQTQKEG